MRPGQREKPGGGSLTFTLLSRSRFELSTGVVNEVVRELVVQAFGTVDKSRATFRPLPAGSEPGQGGRVDGKETGKRDGA